MYCNIVYERSAFARRQNSYRTNLDSNFPTHHFVGFGYTNGSKGVGITAVSNAKHEYLPHGAYHEILHEALHRYVASEVGSLPDIIRNTLVQHPLGRAALVRNTLDVHLHAGIIQTSGSHVRTSTVGDIGAYIAGQSLSRHRNLRWLEPYNDDTDTEYASKSSCSARSITAALPSALLHTPGLVIDAPNSASAQNLRPLPNMPHDYVAMELFFEQ